MALSEEQRALLQLLLEGGQGYDDIGSLLGIGPEQARERAHEALTELGGADPDSQVQLSDYLLGQADPIGRADAVRHLQADPEANELASRLLAQLRLLAPRAELPEVPAPRAGRGRQSRGGAAAGTTAGGTVPAAAPGGRGGEGVAGADKRRSQLLVGAGALALLVVVGILAVAGVFGGDDGGEPAGSATTVASDGEGSAVVRLSPLDGASGASGQAVFARIEEQPVMELNLSGLQPSSEDELYVVWLYANRSAAFPIARDRVGEDGTLTGATPLGSEVIALLTQFGCVDVSLATTAETERAIRQAVRGGGLPRQTGETVLRGQIPATPGEQAPSGADSNCDIARGAQGGGAQGGGAQGGQGQSGGAQGGG